MEPRKETSLLASSGNDPPTEVLIICSNPVLAQTIERLLEDTPKAVHPRTVPGPDAAGTHSNPASAVIIVAPQTWEEMDRWRPALQSRRTASPWLFMARQRIAGLFASVLETRLCTIVDPSALLEQLGPALDALLTGTARFPPAALLTHLAQSLSMLPQVARFVHLTGRELQCGCGASLGLTNRRIAAILFIEEKTVKDHISDLYTRFGFGRKEVWQPLGFSKREALAHLFEMAASSFPASSESPVLRPADGGKLLLPVGRAET